MKDWTACKRILMVRADHMGDVLMSSPAIRAVAEKISAQLTLLTSSKGAGVAKLIPQISEVITFDLPWVKLDGDVMPDAVLAMVDLLKNKQFDGCIIFTVYSQNPLPSAMIAYLAGIPLRMAYCRENPYGLLTHWMPDEEPYQIIRHQVERDLHLLSLIGIKSHNLALALQLPAEKQIAMNQKLMVNGLAPDDDVLILHPGVSEKKRQYPLELWIELAQKLLEKTDFKIVLTGSMDETPMLNALAAKIGRKVFQLGGIFDIPELSFLIGRAKLLLSVNTGVVHLASAMQTPVVVLYAQTNPQHHPWMVKSRVLQYSVENNQRSKNEVIRFVNERFYGDYKPYPTPDEVLAAVDDLLSTNTKHH